MIGGVLIGLVLGIPTGLALQAMRRARKDYVAARVGMPGLRTAYWNGLGKTVRLAAVIAVLAAAMVTWLVNSADADNAEPHQKAPAGNSVRR